LEDGPVLTIGAFSLATGLSVTALRHYDEVGLLRPAVVDAVTGYRRYDHGQVPRGRMYAQLRRVEMPIEAMRSIPDRGLAAVLAEHLDRLRGQADSLGRLIATVDRYRTEGLPVTTTRISQVTIIAPDLAASVAFYRDAFGAGYQEEISSFQFGDYPDDDFFLLTVANPATHPWPGGPVKFGLLVDDVDRAHARALTAGAVEIDPPADNPWKPRSATVQDPAGNHIDLYQA
jgi:DNA-binding transcriptional MerR regulator/catechol 2,3-dioxygenase-like lactoylglutathione lyase family enzyme